MHHSKAIFFCVTWIVALSGALVVSLAEILPFKLSFVRPDNLLDCFTECQVFLALFVWPFFVSGSSWGLFSRAGVLVVASAPLALVCANVSDAVIARVASGQLLVAALAACAAAILSLGRLAAPGYFLGVFALSAGLPLLAFLTGKLDDGADLSFLAVVSPFWAAGQADTGVTVIQAAICGTIAAAISFRKGAAA